MSARYQSGRELAGAFGVVVTLRPSRSIRQAEDLVDAELGRLESSEVGEEELHRAQNMRIASFYYALEHIGGFGGVADRLNAYNVFRGDPGLIGSDVRRFQAVTAGQLREVAVRYLAGRPRLGLSVLGRKETARVTSLDRTAAPPRSVSAAYRAPVPQILRLRCGLPLWVFPHSDLPTVAGSIVISGGASLQPSALPGLSQLTADMLDEGTMTRTAAQIAMAVEAIGVALSASCGWDGSYVGFKCLADDLGTTLDLAADILINPTFPAVEWQRLHGQTLAALRAERDSAESRAYRALLQALYASDHPYRFPLAGTDETVRAIALEDLKAFHACSMVPAQAAIVVAGDVAPEALADELDRRLSGWSGPAMTLPDIPAAAHGSQPRILVLDRPAAPSGGRCRAGHLGIERRNSSFEPMLLFNQVLGGQFTSRLNAKLREERGFTYGVRSGFECPTGRRTVLDRDVRPERPARRGTRRHPTRAHGVRDRPASHPGRVGRRPSVLVEGQPRHFETPSALVSRYANLLIHGLPADHEAGFADRLHQIDRDSLIHAARSLIHPDALVVVVVADVSQVMDNLKRLDWAEPELIEE